ncbi:uncharacterized protein BDZ99DRAFT_525791 [Mytilinidion resinicola]|uniref:Uncharacterized protein n=1 Tax=Mytilinidion resinicola TaxID=574789 RepID=A0A6A6Y692_9PEZI|nr:uncharacterized protein BDZ99DRAFT_525791 [Mytilinidion resinicola]KAF2804200.1 hypothetical protein BDZ99DRAFT_525791 [Mytilinidion resinicola]
MRVKGGLTRPRGAHKALHLPHNRPPRSGHEGSVNELALRSIMRLLKSGFMRILNRCFPPDALRSGLAVPITGDAMRSITWLREGRSSRACKTAFSVRRCHPADMLRAEGSTAKRHFPTNALPQVLRRIGYTSFKRNKRNQSGKLVVARRRISLSEFHTTKHLNDSETDMRQNTTLHDMYQVEDAIHRPLSVMQVDRIADRWEDLLYQHGNTVDGHNAAGRGETLGCCIPEHVQPKLQRFGNER